MPAAGSATAGAHRAHLPYHRVHLRATAPSPFAPIEHPRRPSRGVRRRRTPRVGRFRTRLARRGRHRDGFERAHRVAVDDRAGVRVVGLGRRRKFPSERRRRVAEGRWISAKNDSKRAAAERYEGRERERDDGLDVHLDDHRARLAEDTRGGGVALGDANVALASRRRRARRRPSRRIRGFRAAQLARRARKNARRRRTAPRRAIGRRSRSPSRESEVVVEGTTHGSRAGSQGATENGRARALRTLKIASGHIFANRRVRPPERTTGPAAHPRDLTRPRSSHPSRASAWRVSRRPARLPPP